jgi:hypothetical protein
LALDNDSRILELRRQRMTDEPRTEQRVDIPVPEIGWIATRAVKPHETGKVGTPSTAAFASGFNSTSIRGLSIE